ncbi:MAG: T9SS type A sorting domain-containing protein [Bacteroidota bacterium]
MKIISGILFLLLTGVKTFSQSFQFIESSTGNAAQPFYARMVADTIGDEFTLNCVNNAIIPKNVKVRMMVLSTPAGCTNDIFFCDPIACYPPVVQLSIAPFTIASGDTSMRTLIPHIDPGFCCGDYAVNYSVFDVDNESDSANVVVYYNVNGNHCTNAIGEFNGETYFSIAYPNPATDKCTIEYNFPKENYLSSLALYSISGEKIHEYTLTNNIGEINIDPAPLPGGIYFYSLLIKNNITSFKKLVVIK